MNTIFKTLQKTQKTINFIPRFNYVFPEAQAGQVQANPGLTAKRIIQCVGDRLRDFDQARWESVPITFKTHWRDESGYADVTTAIHIHDALEREFGIDIKDKQVLCTDIETCFYVVMSHHDPL